MRFAPFFLNNLPLICPEPLAAKHHVTSSLFTSISEFSSIEVPLFNNDYLYSLELQQFLQGKLLLLDEIPFKIELLHEHYVAGCLSYEKAIIKNKQGYCCVRCGNGVQRLFASFSCARCQRECTYCRKCIGMGRTSECTPLIKWLGPVQENGIVNESLKWEGTLSKGQQFASNKVIETIHNDDELLIWAVCGAGKTEVLFQGLKQAFQTGKRICITAPRTDVVLELFPRLKKVFPTAAISALYGGSERKDLNTNLVISTTHQLLRCYDWFDVLIIDEVDAFPYSIDPMLSLAARRAAKKTASVIYLTATPNESLQRKAASNSLPYVKIPLRYHGHPLPVPVFSWCGNWRKQLQKKNIPSIIMNWIQAKLSLNRQLFLFVPKIEMMPDIVACLKTYEKRIESVHAEDRYRKEKVTAFREGSIRILVTTTILERGVTVPCVDVGVLGSEDSIFTESALVQIAGRVGRSSDAPSGDVIFFHYGKTNAMTAAKKHIQKMNALGKHSK
jgi:competence protein ComFA